MPRTVSDVISAAREVLQDVRAPFRYSNDTLATAVTEAVGEIRRVRPDLFLADMRAGLPMYTALTLGAVLPIPDFLFVPVVNFVAGRAELRDDQFTTDGRAVTLIQLFTAGIGGRN